MNQRLFELDPIGLLLHSFVLLYRDLPMWIRLNLLGLLLTLPVVTAGAARAGVYFTVRAWLLDRIDGGYTVQKAFFEGFRSYFRQGTLVGLLNLMIGVIIAFSIGFWLTSEVAVLNYVAVVGVYALLMWLICQPYIYPLLVMDTERRPPRTLWLAARLMISTPLYTLLIVLLLLGVNLIAVVLLGPVLLILDVYVALLTTQTLWVITDEPLPGLRRREV
jgi:uncharacterized membrane protein YesL